MPVTFSDGRIVVFAALSAVLAGSAAAQTDATLAAQQEAYEAVRAKSIIELQPFRHEMTAVRPDTGAELTLISLNPGINSWFLLAEGPEGRRSFVHLENPDPDAQTVTLDGGDAPALVLEKDGRTQRCRPWEGELAEAQATRVPYTPICDGALFLRNRVNGYSTNLEKTTDFLRDNVWGGEQVVRFIRDNFFKDKFAETSKSLGMEEVVEEVTGPPPLPLNVSDFQRPVMTALHDFGLEGAQPGRMTMGIWYPVADLDGVFVSSFQPRSISAEILQGPGTTNWLDGVEGAATGYMVAFDLSLFELGYARGTDHPGVEWSPRPPWNVRPQGLSGPDGFNRVDPVVPLGMVSPRDAPRTIATFTAGYKRQHGAFRWGPFAEVNFGSHYGFLEHGVLYSKLWPGLSTFFILDDGSIHMRTWTEDDDALLPRLRFARQNGVALVEPDPETGVPLPGQYVTQWGPGNWSGSAEAELRTLRAGACIVEGDDTRYLLYGYFSTATPSAMARTFQGYGCTYAMLLDMNALEHTYLALYVRRDGSVEVQHIVPGMSGVDKRYRDGTVIPRFLGYPDNRDLFYVMRKEGTQ